ncbi:uncharacterized protein CIMG_12844 [Coccidioides immitis RS]|uniref:Uncharacterized protein n=1 Tax=Coccidioides immitis (strain RS) TaxID=246410 RepID=J3KHM4_COCIM|nr:uncharacterized protein CIMG_12844 [Coccidioides immitis RS]EAS35385.3 hypothetical protein CIMG_12844 [Coccidioides immitis RS]
MATPTLNSQSVLMVEMEACVWHALDSALDAQPKKTWMHISAGQRAFRIRVVSSSGISCPGPRFLSQFLFQGWDQIEAQLNGMGPGCLTAYWDSSIGTEIGMELRPGSKSS